MTSQLRIRVAGLMLVATALIAACGGGAKDVFDEPASASSMPVRLDNYKVETKTAAVTTAVTRFVVQNVGTTEHEVKLVRTDLAPDALPQKDGVVEEAKLDILGKATNLKRRDKKTFDVTLAPGKYVLICNISGHYALGMRTGLEVTAAP